jgi:transposase-like protein
LWGSTSANLDLFVLIKILVAKYGMWVVTLCQWNDVEAELDEMWGFVKSKKEQRWLWHAIDHKTGEILAYVLSGHKDEAFLRLKELLEPTFRKRYR